MAKATICKPEPVVQPPLKVILELSEGEARFLSSVLGRTSGSVAAGSIYRALNDAKMFGHFDYSRNLPSIKCQEAERALSKARGGC